MNHSNELIVSHLMNNYERTVNTGITYLSIPEPQIQIVKSQQSLESKYQIEHDFSIRYRYLNSNELDQIFVYIDKITADRYKTVYENLYKNVLQSLLNNFDLNEEILELKHSIKYQNEILPILIHNHKLAKREKKILYYFLTKIWKIFDERIQNELNLQDQLEQMKNEHQQLKNNKIKQEQYQMSYLKISREIYLPLKTERRTIERQLNIKLKQYTTEDRLNHTLTQQYDSLLARKKLEQIRVNTLNEQLASLIHEHTRLKDSYEQLYNQSTKTNPTNLFELRENILNLKQIHQTCIQDKILYDYKKTNYENVEGQLQRKNQGISNRINQILKRIKQCDSHFKENLKHIQILENKLNEEQQQYVQSKNILTNMKHRSESFQNKQHLIQTQIQLTSNNIQHAQYRLKTFTEQLYICRNDLIEQQTSLKKLREFYSVIKEQNEINQKKFLTLHIQYTNLKNQYKTSQKSLQQIREDLSKSSNVRINIGHMVIRRINLCQLLYKKLAKLDEYIHQRDDYIQMIIKCMKTLKLQIHQVRNQNKKILQKRDQIQLEVLKVHREKLVDQSHKRQRFLKKQIFQRHFSIKSSYKPLPTEELSYLNNKYYLLKGRLIKMVLRGIICNFVFLSIERDFVYHLQIYTSKSNRENFINLNVLRTNLYQLMRQLNAKTAENNMLIDYQYYFHLIYTDIIQQLTQ